MQSSAWSRTGVQVRYDSWYQPVVKGLAGQYGA
jgi:hypothetical protein